MSEHHRYSEDYSAGPDMRTDQRALSHSNMCDHLDQKGEGTETRIEDKQTYSGTTNQTVD